VSASLGHDDTVIFAVADTGIGIAPADQDRNFMEWEQVEGKIQKTAKGTGSGLPLSRKLAQLLGGNAYVKSQVGIGSTFFAAIPMRYGGATEAVYVPDVKRELDASKLPVLVVEDNREALFVYEKYLKGTEFQVVPAQDLREATRAAVVPARGDRAGRFVGRRTFLATAARHQTESADQRCAGVRGDPG
jgi:hypothetical protein